MGLQRFTMDSQRISKRLPKDCLRISLGLPNDFQLFSKGFPMTSNQFPKGFQIISNVSTWISKKEPWFGSKCFVKDFHMMTNGFPMSLRIICKGLSSESIRISNDFQGISKWAPMDFQGGLPLGSPYDLQSISNGFPKDSNGCPKWFPNDCHRLFLGFH